MPIETTLQQIVLNLLDIKKAVERYQCFIIIIIIHLIRQIYGHNKPSDKLLCKVKGKKHVFLLFFYCAAHQVEYSRKLV
jgi:hypothetical protein